MPSARLVQPHLARICWVFSRLDIAGNRPSPRIHLGEKPFCNQSVSRASTASLCFRARCGLGLAVAGFSPPSLSSIGWGQPQKAPRTGELKPELGSSALQLLNFLSKGDTCYGSSPVPFQL